MSEGRRSRAILLPFSNPAIWPAELKYLLPGFISSFQTPIRTTIHLGLLHDWKQPPATRVTWAVAVGGHTLGYITNSLLIAIAQTYCTLHRRHVPLADK